MDCLLSVIIPAHDHARSLPVAIDSVKAQGWPGLEIIVVDDGSRDGTSEWVVRRYGKGLRLIRQAHCGPAAARNAGIRAARGDWVAFLDADDRWLPKKLAIQFGAMERRPDAEFCYGDVLLQEAMGDERYVSCSPRGEDLLWKLLPGNCLATPTVLVRKEALERVGLFDTRLRSGEDWDLWLRLAARAECLEISQPLAVVVRSETPKYPVQLLEQCTLTVLDNFFSCFATGNRISAVASLKARVYAWHYSVLAKSYLRHRRLAGFLRLCLKAICADPAGIGYLLKAEGASFRAKMGGGSGSGREAGTPGTRLE